MAKTPLLTGAALAMLAACTPNIQASEAQDLERRALTPLAPVAAANDASSIARHLDVRYRVTANKGDGGCPANADGSVLNEPCYEAQIVLSSDVPLDLSQSAIYFSQIDPVAYVAPDNRATLAHINGDLHILRLVPETQMIQPAAPLQVAFTVRGLALNRAKFMPNYYVVDGAGESAVIASTSAATVAAAAFISALTSRCAATSAVSSRACASDGRSVRCSGGGHSRYAYAAPRSAAQRGHKKSSSALASAAPRPTHGA